MSTAVEWPAGTWGMDGGATRAGLPEAVGLALVARGSRAVVVITAGLAAAA